MTKQSINRTIPHLTDDLKGINDAERVLGIKTKSMIQIEDLRIKNLVLYNGKTFNISAMRISAPYDLVYVNSDWVPIKHIKGVELEKEWFGLMKFKEESEGVYSIGLPNGNGVDLVYEFGNVCLRRNHVGNEIKEGDKNPYDYCYIKDCDYVHEIQNIYHSLSGKEL